MATREAFAEQDFTAGTRDDAGHLLVPTADDAVEVRLSRSRLTTIATDSSPCRVQLWCSWDGGTSWGTVNPQGQHFAIPHAEVFPCGAATRIGNEATRGSVPARIRAHLPPEIGGVPRRVRVRIVSSRAYRASATVETLSDPRLRPTSKPPASVAIDTCVGADIDSGTGGTVSVTVATNSDRVLVGTFTGGGTGAPTAVTFNSVAMTAIANANDGFASRTDAYYLLAPDQTTANLSFAFSGGKFANMISALAVYGAAQQAPSSATASGTSGSSINASTTGYTGGLACCAGNFGAASGSPTIDSQAGQTHKHERETTPGGGYAMAFATETGDAGGNDMGFTVTGITVNSKSLVVVGIDQAAAASTVNRLALLGIGA